MSHVASAWHEAWRAASNLIFRLTNRSASDAARLILMRFFLMRFFQRFCSNTLPHGVVRDHVRRWVCGQLSTLQSLS
jgi:hypothetical protein